MLDKNEVSLFLFCHQDDEFGVYEQLHEELRRGHRVVCIYVTSGVSTGEDPSRRNLESQRVLQELGVARDDIIFGGQILKIPDGQLAFHLKKLSNWLLLRLKSFDTIRAVYVPAWEGGHPDHDLLHAVVVRLCHSHQICSSVMQFSLYNGYKCIRPFFRVLSPLDYNGEKSISYIPWRHRIRYLSFALFSYPSQRKSWFGLFPFVLAHYLCSGKQELQSTSIARTYERPHKGLLYYEARGFLPAEIVFSKLKELECDE